MKNDLDLDNFKKEVCNIYENLDNIKQDIIIFKYKYSSILQLPKKKSYKFQYLNKINFSNFLGNKARG